LPRPLPPLVPAVRPSPGGARIRGTERRHDSPRPGIGPRAASQVPSLPEGARGREGFRGGPRDTPRQAARGCRTRSRPALRPGCSPGSPAPRGCLRGPKASERITARLLPGRGRSFRGCVIGRGRRPLRGDDRGPDASGHSTSKSERPLSRPLELRRCRASTTSDLRRAPHGRRAAVGGVELPASHRLGRDTGGGPCGSSFWKDSASWQGPWPASGGTRSREIQITCQCSSGAYRPVSNWLCRAPPRCACN